MSIFFSKCRILEKVLRRPIPSSAIKLATLKQSMGYCSCHLSFFLFPLIFLSFYFFVSSGPKAQWLMCVYSSLEKWGVVCVMGFLSSLLLSYSLSPMHKIAAHIHTHAHTIINSRHILSNQFPVDKSKRAFYICKREAVCQRGRERERRSVLLFDWRFLWYIFCDVFLSPCRRV